MDTEATTSLSVSNSKLDSNGYVQAAFLVILSVIVVAGNILTIMAVYKNPHLRTVPNMYVVSLSCADILAGVSMFYVGLTLTPDLIDAFIDRKYLCLLKYVMVYVSLGASSSNLVSIAVDRYLYILHPMKYAIVVTSGKAAVVIASSWVMALVLGTMPVYINTWEPGVKCYIFHVLHIWFMIPTAVFLFGACTFITMFCYGRIMFVARQQMKRIQTIGPSVQVNTLVGPQVRKDWKLIKMFILVFGVFFACWTPSAVGIFVGVNGGTSDQYMGYAMLLLTINSGMNVFIYAFKNQGFRKAFQKILYRKWLGKVFKMCGKTDRTPEGTSTSGISTEEIQISTRSVQ